MKNKVLKGLLSLALASSLTLTGPANPTYAASFKDIKSHWSKQVVEKSYALAIMKGYPGDVFKPEDPVSRLEAIVIIINAMGLEKDAVSLDYKKSGVTLPKGMIWGQGYLVLATQKGLLHKDYVSQLMYNNPITRQEVAALVAVALKDKLKVKGDSAKLTYKDTSQISVTFLPYVADVSQNDIMQGIENNEFGPNQIMKRGQMAALMVKTSLNGWFDYGKDKIVTGTLTGIDASSGIATVVKSDGTQMPRLVDSKTVFYKGSTESSQSEFKNGDQVVALVGSDAKIKYMESGGSTGNTPAPPPAAETKVTVEGEITSIISSNFNLKTASGTIKSFNVKAGEIKVTEGNNIIAFSELKTGDKVRVISVNSEAREITIISRGSAVSAATQEAQVRSVDDFYGYISVRYSNGSRKEYEVELRATIKKDDERISLKDIEPGDNIDFRVGADGKIFEIIVEDDSMSESGKVTDLQTGNNQRIYIDSDRYDVEDDVIVTRDGDEIDLEDVVIGAKVTIKLNDDDEVTKIEVTDDEDITVEGTVDDVDEDAEEITIEQENGLEFTFDVDSGCDFRDSTSSSSNINDLDDVERGWEVKLDLENGKVEKITITSK